LRQRRWKTQWLLHLRYAQSAEHACRTTAASAMTEPANQRRSSFTQSQTHKMTVSSPTPEATSRDGCLVKNTPYPFETGKKNML